MKTVMVVDDSRFVYDSIKQALAGSEEFELAGYSRSAEQALKNYAEAHPDVVLMDVILAGQDGILTTHAILTKWPDACVVFVTGLADEETLNRCREAGARDVIIKPFDGEQLLDVLREVTA